MEEVIDTSFFEKETEEEKKSQKTASISNDINGVYSFRQLGSLATFVEPINGESSIDVLIDIFTKDESIDVVPIEEYDRVVGFFDRNLFNKITSSAWKRFMAKEVISYVTKVSIVFYAHDYIEKIMDRVIDFNQKHGIQFFPVFSNRAFYGFFSLEDFLQRYLKIREQDMQKAKSVQQNLLPDPKCVEKLPFRTTIWNRMANEVGGDFYIAQPISDTKSIVACFDVSGKNIAAALITIAVGTFFKDTIKSSNPNLSPKAYTSLLDQYLCNVVPVGNFITAVLCYVDIEKQTLCIHNCGHTTTYIFSSDDENGKKVILSAIEPSLPPLGMGVIRETFEGEPEKNNAFIKLKKGMRLCLYSDGLTDLTSDVNERFGEENTKKLFIKTYRKDSEFFISTVEKTVKEWIEHSMLSDDITIMDVVF